MRTLFLGFVFSFVLGAADQSPVRYVGKTKYLNNAHAIVAHTIDERPDLVLPLRALCQLRIHSEEDCRRRLHCGAQLSR
jgi:hypothetical protein